MSAKEVTEKETPSPKVSSSDHDIEKNEKLSSHLSHEEEVIAEDATQIKQKGAKAFYNNLMSMMHGETRGIERIPEEEKTQTSIYGCATMWLSANLVIATFSLGALSYSVFGLDFGTAVLTIFFFSILGGMPVGFMSVFGAKFGLRQMVLSRYLIGNVGMRIFAFINCIACVGWGAVNIMSSAQLLHIINGGLLPPWAGCLILVLCTILVTFFGYNVIHAYEKWSWVPNGVCFIAIIARLSMDHVFTSKIPDPNDPAKWIHWGSGSSYAGEVLSFGGTIFGFAAGWTTYAADYTVYMRSDTNPYKIFFGVVAGLCTPLIFTLTLGAAAITGIKTSDVYLKLYDEYSVGGLVYAILVQDSLHRFGEFLCVLLAMSTVCNNIPNMYSIGLGAMTVWSKFAKVPRIVWTLVGNGLTLAICIPAYYSFASVVDNFMNLIGYYLAIYDAICLTEHFVFRRGFGGYNLEYYDQLHKLNPGYAGAMAFFCGVAGVVVGMDQTWFAGPIAKKIGDYGGDIGFELGAGFAFITYICLRPIEKKKFGR